MKRATAHKHLRRPPLVVLLAIVASGVSCSVPTAPESSEVGLQVAPSGSASAPARSTSPPSILVEGRRVVVLGLMTTPDPCRTISASRQISRNEVTIRMTARSDASPCVTVVAEFAYRATTPLAPGTYLIKVVHEYPGTGWPTVVAGEATVVIRW